VLFRSFFLNNKKYPNSIKLNQMKSSFPGKKIDDYVLTNVIGKGAFGEVYEA